MNFSISKRIITNSKQKQKLNKSSSPLQKTSHKKQIQSTLNQLYLLQSQMQKLNVPQNPHSSSPIKKQVKNLSLMYENMTKKKVKNNLNIQLNDIKTAFKIINEGNSSLKFQNQIKDLKNEISLFNKIRKDEQNGQQTDHQDEIPSEILKQLVKQIYGCQFDAFLIVEDSKQKDKQIKADEIYNFLNFNQSDNFDPLKQAYNCLLDEYGNFSLEKYNEINQLIGLPQIQDFQTFEETLRINQNEHITFQKFKQIIKNGKDLYLND